MGKFKDFYTDSKYEGPENYSMSDTKFDIGSYNAVPFSLYNFRYAGGQHLSAEAILLYGILLSRIALSIKNKNCFMYEKQEGNEAYCICTQEEIMALLSIGKDKAGKTFQELESAELIERKMVCGKIAHKIFVRKIDSVYHESAEIGSHSKRKEAALEKSINLLVEAEKMEDEIKKSKMQKKALSASKIFSFTNQQIITRAEEKVGHKIKIIRRKEKAA